MRTGATVSSLRLLPPPLRLLLSRLFYSWPNNLCKDGPNPSWRQTPKDFEGRWEALSRLITKETRWQFKSRRNAHKWMTRGFSTSRRDCQTTKFWLQTEPWKQVDRFPLKIESKIRKLVKIFWKLFKLRRISTRIEPETRTAAFFFFKKKNTRAHSSRLFREKKRD